MCGHSFPNGFHHHFKLRIWMWGSVTTVSFTSKDAFNSFTMLDWSNFWSMINICSWGDIYLQYRSRCMKLAIRYTSLLSMHEISDTNVITVSIYLNECKHFLKPALIKETMSSTFLFKRIFSLPQCFKVLNAPIE